MFHISGLRIGWYVVLVNVYCTNSEATFLLFALVYHHEEACIYRSYLAVFLCSLTSLGVNLSYILFRDANAGINRAKTLFDY